MELKMCSLPLTSPAGQINVCHNTQSDIIVPDTKPDVFRILSVKSVVDLSGCHTKKDKVTFSGNIKYNIFYIGEEEQNRICTIEYTAPFSHVAEKSGVSEDMSIRCASNVSKVNCDIVNSRKVCVSAKIDIFADTALSNETEAVSGEDIPDSLAFQAKEYEYDVLRSKNSFEFTVSDSVNICGGESFEIYDIIAYEDISEIKAVNNKAVIKGQVNISILYDNNGDISGYNTDIPFTEIVDIDNLSSDQILMSHFEIASVGYTMPENSEETDLGISVTIKGNIWGYETTKNNFATDIYSPDYSSDIRFRNCTLSKVSDVKHSSITIKDTLTPSGSSLPISKVHCAFCTITNEESKLSEGTLRISGNMESVAICSDESDNLFSVRGTSAFETEFDFPDCDPQSKIFSDVSLINSGYVLTSSSDVQIRAVAKVSASVICEKEIPVITHFSVDEKSPVKKDEQPSILVYYPDEGASLWDIAKKYNTTSEEIIAVNSLDKDNPITKGVPVLITKRYVK